MLVHEITTRCHSCARPFEIIVDDHLDSDTYEIPEGECATCAHCGREHTAGFEMAVLEGE